MTTLEISLIEWPEDRETGGPRLLGRTSDPDLIELVKSAIARQHREQIERLEAEDEEPVFCGNISPLNRYTPLCGRQIEDSGILTCHAPRGHAGDCWASR